jgi:hypothetical protein
MDQVQTNNAPAKISGRPLSSDEQAKFKSTIKVAFSHLENANVESSPDVIVAAIDDHLRKWKNDQKGFMNKLFKRAPKESAGDLANSLGILWGTQLVERFHWEWMELDDASKKTTGVASPDRSLVVYPQAHIRRYLAGEDGESAILASFRSISSERLPVSSPGAYKDIMTAFRR